MISYYDLLGLIKEGKQPNKVKYDGDVYIWDGCNYKGAVGYLMAYLHEINMFDKNIEIIEEKPKQIKKLLNERLSEDGLGLNSYEKATRMFANQNRDKIEELINAVNYLLGEDKHE